MEYCVCKQCGEKVTFDYKVLRAHLRTDHYDRFIDMQIYSDHDMLHECYKVIDETIPT